MQRLSVSILSGDVSR
jgi:hypothetical protein